METPSDFITPKPTADSNDLPNLICHIPDHGKSKIVGFCIDDLCNEENKFVCVNCFFDPHSQHKIIKIDKLDKLLISKLTEYRKHKEEIKISKKIYIDKEKEISNKIDTLKNNINKIIDEKISIFKEDLFKKFENMNKNTTNFENIKNFENFIISNQEPANQNKLTELSTIYSEIYLEYCNEIDKKNEEEKEITINEIEEKTNKELNNILTNFNKQFENYSTNQLQEISNFLNKNFLTIPNNFMTPLKVFEWCKKTYQGYDFLYEISEKKITKNKLQGTMTVARCSNCFEKNYKYIIECKIGFKYGGDLDIGVGNDKAGETCWLRSRNSCGLSTSGIYNKDQIFCNKKCLKDEDKVKMEIIFGDKKKNFKGFINDEEVCNFELDIENVYLMVAIRNQGNFVEIIKSEISHL